MPNPIILEVGDAEFEFHVDHTDINEFFNSATPHDKISPAFNLIMGTVLNEQKAALKGMLLDNGTIRGVLAMQLAGKLVDEAGGDIEVRVKKPKRSPPALPMTA